MQTEELSMEVSMTMEEACRLWRIDPVIQNNLQREGITEFFEIQTKAIPQILDCDTCGIARDISICAPTGSGKTLVYIIPIIQSLMHRIVPRIRALVVVPSRDLAIQAKATFDTYVQGTGLHVGILGGVDDSLDYCEDDYWLNSCDSDMHLLKSCEKVDIAVTTPGKLVEHIKNDPSFDIQDLRYLIVDEADKLLLQSFSNWIHVLYAKLDETPISSFEKTNQHYQIQSSTNRTNHPNGSIHVVKGIRKILLSATLNSEKNINIQKLRLSNLLIYTVKNISTNNVFTVPEELHEQYYVCEPVRKPLYLLSIVQSLLLQNKKILTFCNSIDTVHRVFTLVKLFFDNNTLINTSQIAEYSSQISSKQREEVMAQFQQGTIRLLISSDTIARGIDIPCIDVVINYDIPSYTETYIHRSGRTARAKREGNVISIIRQEQEQFFKHMTRKIIGSRCERQELENVSSEMQQQYIEAIQGLKEVLEKEKRYRY